MGWFQRTMSQKGGLKKFMLVYGTFFGSVGLFCYGAIIFPMMNPDYFREMQAKGRAGINQADIQPGGMKVWSDPFDRKKDQ